MNKIVNRWRFKNKESLKDESKGFNKWCFTKEGAEFYGKSEYEVYKEKFRHQSDKGILFISLEYIGFINSKYLIPYKEENPKEENQETGSDSKYKWIFTEKALTLLPRAKRKVYNEISRENFNFGTIINLEELGGVNLLWLSPFDSKTKESIYNSAKVNKLPKANESLNPCDLPEVKAIMNRESQDKRFELIKSIIQGFCSNPNHEIFTYEEEKEGSKGDVEINDFIIDKSIEIADKILDKLK